MTTGRRLVIVFVVDGLRPDSITAEDTPTLFRLRAEGVSFADSHAVFPTVTRVNAAALSTGTQPGTNGLLGNQLYLPAVDPRRAVDTGNYRNLLALDQATGGRLLMAPTLAERLHARGLRLPIPRRSARRSSPSSGRPRPRRRAPPATTRRSPGRSGCCANTCSRSSGPTW